MRAIPVLLRQRHPTEPTAAGAGRAVGEPGEGPGCQGLRGEIDQVQGPQSEGVRGDQGLPGRDGGHGGPAEQIGVGDEGDGEVFQIQGGGVPVARQQCADVGECGSHRREHMLRWLLQQGAGRPPEDFNQRTRAPCCPGDQQRTCARQPFRFQLA